MDITKIAWLAGLFDGEGTLGFYRTRRKNGTYFYQKAFCIACADSRIVNQASSILSEIIGYSVPVCLDWRPSKLRPSVYFKMSMRKHEDLLRVLECLEPYLVGKKDEAQLMLNLLRTHKKGSLYTHDHIALVEALKIAKRVGFIRGNPELAGSIGFRASVETIQGAS